MSGEITVPLLPCPSIDEIADFYQMLGAALPITCSDTAAI